MSSSLCRVLFVSASPEGEPRVGDDRELNRIRRSIREVGCDDGDVENVPACSTEDLRLALIRHKPTVLHVAAHGIHPWILLDDGTGGSRELHIDALVAVIAACPSTRLVILSACESWPMAAPLLDVPHVQALIASEGRFPVEHAIEFGADLHASLARGGSVAEAFGCGRAAVTTARGDASVLRLRPSNGCDPTTLRFAAEGARWHERSAPDASVASHASWQAQTASGARHGPWPAEAQFRELDEGDRQETLRRMALRLNPESRLDGVILSVGMPKEARPSQNLEFGQRVNRLVRWAGDEGGDALLRLFRSLLRELERP